MQDIREVARQIVDHARLNPKLAPPRNMRPLTEFSPAFPTFVHGLIRSYAVDMLLSIAQAMQPSDESEAKAVAWLRGELVKIAQGIPPEMGQPNITTPQEKKS